MNRHLTLLLLFLLFMGTGLSAQQVTFERSPSLASTKSPAVVQNNPLTDRSYLTTVNFNQLQTRSAFTRKAVIEEFTNASCGPCASQNPKFNTLLSDNSDKVVVIKYQTAFPGFDPMNKTNPDEVDARFTEYYNYTKAIFGDAGMTGVPTAFVNGILGDNTYGGGIGAWQPAPNGYWGGPYGFNQAVIDYASSLPVTLAMTVDHTLNAYLDTMFITINVINQTDGPIAKGDLILHSNVQEKTIEFPSAPGNNGEKYFSDIFRKSATSIAGDDVLPDTLGASESVTFTYAVPLKSYIFNKKGLYATAFLQHKGNKEIIYGEASVASGFPDGSLYYDIALENITEFDDNLCTEDTKFTPSIKVSNTGTLPVYDLKFNYVINGGTPVTYTYTDTILPGASAIIEFPEVDIYKGKNANLKYNFLGFANPNFSEVDLINNLLSDLNFVYVSTDPIGTSVSYTFENATPGQLNYPQGVLNVPKEGNFIYIMDKTFLGATGADLGGYGKSKQSLFANFYGWDPSQTAGTESVILDKMTFKDRKDVYFKFDRAYSGYQSAEDAMDILYSTDCGTTWTSIKYYTGNDLKTTIPSANPFVPTAAMWKTDSIAIPALAGIEDVIFKLDFISGWGNFLYVDNINIGSQSALGVNKIDAVAAISIFPNPATSEIKLHVTALNNISTEVKIVDARGKMVKQVANAKQFKSGENEVIINIENLPSGIYFLQMSNTNGINTVPFTVIK